MLNLVRRTIRHDATWLLAGRVAQLGNGFLLSIALVRLFGLASAGTYTIAALGIMASTLLCTAGQIHSLPRSGLSVKQGTFVSLVSSLLAAPVSLAIVAALGWFMAQSDDEFWEIAVFGLSGVMMAQMSVTSMLLVIRQSAFLTVVAPLIGTLGIVAGSFVASTPIEFATYVTLSRLLANVMIYAIIGMEVVPFRRVMAEIRAGAKFMLTDGILLVNDQIGTIILAFILSRGDMGVWGICRQLLVAADTPSWSITQAKYPAMVQDLLGTYPDLRRNLLHTSIAVAAVGAVGSYGMGLYVYNVALLGPLMLIALASLSARYLQNLDDQAMRAVGASSLCVRLAIYRLPPTVVFLTVMALVWGIWGTVISFTISSICLMIVYRIVARSTMRNLDNQTISAPARQGAPA